MTVVYAWLRRGIFDAINSVSLLFRYIPAVPGAWRQKFRAGICKDVCIDPGFSNAIRTVPDQQANAY